MIKRESGCITALAKRINDLHPEEGLVKAIDGVVPELEAQLAAKKRTRNAEEDMER